MAEEQVKVRHKGNNPDTNGVPRSDGEVYELPAARANNLARSGFVDLLDDDGQIIALDVEFDPSAHSLPSSEDGRRKASLRAATAAPAQEPVESTPERTPTPPVASARKRSTRIK